MEILLPSEGQAAAVGLASADDLFRQVDAMAQQSNWVDLQALLTKAPDHLIDARSLLLLAKAARKTGEAEVLERVTRLGAGAGWSASERVTLVMKLMEDRGSASTAAAWRVLSGDPEIFRSKSAANAVRWLAMLRLRLPEGEVRQAADDLLSRHRKAFPDMDSLEGVELRENLRLLADAKDWASICALAATAPDRHLTGDAPEGLLTAALQQSDDSSVQRALGLLEETLQRPRRRLWAARQLAVAGRVAAAWSMLDIPAFLGGEAELRQALLELLPLLSRRAEGALREEVRSVIQQLSAPRLDPLRVLPFPAIHRTVTPAAAVGPIRILRTGNVGDAQAAVFARLAEEHERRVARSMAAEGKDLIRWPELQVYQDVFVDRQGRIWDEAGRVAPLLYVPTLAGIPPAEGAAFLPEAAVSSVPNNFFHWFAEGFPALAWRLRQGAAQHIPILVNPEAYPFLRETFDLLSDEPPEVVVLRDTVRVGRALTTYRGANFLLHWNCYGEIYERLVDRAQARGASAQAGRLVYLSRRNASARRLENEQSLEDELVKLGFAVVTLEKHSLAEQICIIQGADVVVAPHGAGLAHLVAARPGLRVFEMMPARAGTESLRSAFARLSVLRGHHHLLWLEQAHPVSDRWRVDIPAMLAALRRFMEEPPAR